MFEKYESLLVLFYEINRELEEQIRTTFIEHKLDITTILIIRYIIREPGIIVSEVARRLGIVKSQVSKIIEKLNQKGWIEKRPDPSDHRILRLYLKESGIEEIKRIKRVIWKKMGYVAVDIEENQINEMIKSLKQIEAILASLKE